jgi:DNA end-binding protein Ku
MRPIWSGAISFGLIYIPVRLYNASQDQELDFDLLRRGDLCRIRYSRICEETGEEVDYADIVKGYEYEDGKYVVLEDEDFTRANVRKTRTIDIASFIDAGEIDQKYLEKPYYLEPQKGAEKVYALLREALKNSGKAGVARFVLSTREHLAVIKAEGQVIVLNQMRFPSEIRPTDNLELPEEGGFSERELDMAVKLVDRLTEPWEPGEFHDTYVEDLKHIIQEKINGKELEPVEEEPIPEEVTDLFAKLSESLELANRRRVDGNGSGNRKRNGKNGNR